MLIQLCKNFPELKDKYFINEQGELFTDFGKRQLTDCVGTKGYIKNGLMLTNGQTKGYFRHRLVLQSFNPILDYDKKQVNHIDGNKKNNSLNNLEWCTNQENRIHAVQHGLAAHMDGETNPFHKLTESEVINIIQDLQNHISYSQLVIKYNCSKSTLSAIKHKRNWKYLTQDIIFT